MPQRRRGKAASARAAAIQAVNRKRKADQEQQQDATKQQIPQPPTEEEDFDEEDYDDAGDYDDESWEDDDEDENPPPLVDNQEEFCTQGQGDDEEFEEEDEDDDDDDDVAAVEGAGSNATSGEGGCLHCHKNATPSDIQVRCDECQSYICQSCHWCHEFQANHEIRVCDRCDAFYCRTCDEMDQCDDCGEVVCASCSTLLSCKFCGGGLCEECATACGRCGIVLCSRDAKFAVDCDTCRLSYCLVCLASGSKDPCVRCGHRPSKRMEQLVHLRLKSIYKAFKQSSRTNSKHGEDGDDVHDDDDDDDDDNDDDNDDDHDGHNHHHHHHVGKSGDPQTLLQAAASAASKHNSGKGSSHHHHHHHQHTTSKRPGGHGGGSSNSAQQAKDMVEKYMAEKEKADAAAAALLAELDEEEAVEKSKKKKKKRKKERAMAKKADDDDVKDDEPQAVEPESDSDDDIKLSAVVTKKGSKKKGKSKQGKAERKNNNETQKDGMALSNEELAKKYGVPLTPLEPEEKTETEEPQVDPTEQRLCELVADEDADGLEDLLAELKGVPGRATLRKNAKKALKRLRAAEEEEAEALAELARKKKPEVASQQDHQPQQQQSRSVGSGGAATPATQSETTNSSGLPLASRPPPPEPLQQQELIKVVSHSHSKSGAGSGVVSATHRPSRGPATASAAATTAGAKAECVLHMSPAVVGWVIGKGGQRIRDLMEESGAKVWIDQEHLSPSDPRIVYVSGNRKNVDLAVRMIKELVSKTPGMGSAATGTTPAAAPPIAKSNSAAGVKIDAGVSGKPSQSSSEKNDASLVTGVGVALSSLNLTPSLPVGVAAGSTAVKAGGEKLKKGDTLHEMTCEACFVPLLIGRRGWTIKHIQDSSGARVDIDQSVTPRKIKISGSNDNVQAAIRMVRDVLSYPHAQLQGASSAADLEQKQAEILPALGGLGGAGAVVPPSSGASHDFQNAADAQVGTLSNTTTVEAGNQYPALSKPQSSPPQTADDRAHTPPPSSLINIGDAKSTISASSSLSSTPEPSMASTAKGHFAGIGTGPLFPSDFGGPGQYQQQQQQQQQPPTVPSPNSFNPQTGLHQMSAGVIPDNRSGPAPGANMGISPLSPHVPSQMFPNGGGMPTDGMASPQYGLPPSLPRSFPQQQQQHLHDPNMILGSGMLQQQNPQPHPLSLRHANGLAGGMHQPNSQFLHPHDPQRGLHQNNPLDFSAGVPGQPNPMELRQQSAFHPSSQKQFSPSAAHSMQGNFAPSGMWNDRGASLMLGPEGTTTNASPGQQLNRPPLADSFQRDGLPLPSLNGQGNIMQASPQVDLGSALLGMAGVSVDAGIEAGFRQGTAVQQTGLPPVGRDDSRLVDSLFGPPEGGDVGAVHEEKSVLPGFSGLSLNDGVNAGVWRSAPPNNEWEGGNETQGLSADFRDDQKGSSDLFASIQPTLAAHEVQHPSRSRFIWGTASHDSQGKSP